MMARPRAQRVSVPVTINGRIQQPTDNDYFMFAAKAGQVLALEVQARRLGSPVDSMLYLYNAQGGELNRNDEWVDPAEAAAHAPRRLADRLHVSRRRRLRGADQGHPAPRWRRVCLSTADRAAASRLRVADHSRQPAGQQGRYGVRHGAGGAHGRIRRRNRPRPCRICPPVFWPTMPSFPPDRTRRGWRSAAPPDATANVVTPTIVGTADIGGTAAVRLAQAVENVTQAFSLPHTVPTQELAVAVIEPVLLTLSTSIAPTAVQDVKPGTGLPVVVKATRHGGSAGPVTLALDGAPPWLTLQPAPAEIPADQSELTVTLAVAADAPVGPLQNIFITGTLNTGQATASRFAPAVPIRVVASP